MKISVKQLKTTVNCIISRQDQTEEKVSEMENRIEETFHIDYHKGKNEYLWLQHTKSLEYYQKTKGKNSWGGRKNWNTNWRHKKPFQWNHSRKFPGLYFDTYTCAEALKTPNSEDKKKIPISFIIRMPKRENKEIILKFAKLSVYIQMQTHMNQISQHKH